MQLVITFCGGSGRYNNPLTVHGTLHVTNGPAEVDPEDVFKAANRVGSQADDLRGLHHDWQCDIRRAIDAAHNCLPSMSVNDTIELVSDAGRHLGGWRCDPSGWSPIAPASTHAA